jgi:hypothetical protein
VLPGQWPKCCLVHTAFLLGTCEPLISRPAASEVRRPWPITFLITSPENIA